MGAKASGGLIPASPRSRPSRSSWARWPALIALLAVTFGGAAGQAAADNPPAGVETDPVVAPSDQPGDGHLDDSAAGPQISARQAAASAATADGPAIASPGQVIEDLTSVTPLQLAQQLAGPGVTISSASFTGSALAGGRFSGMGATGISSGVVLSSGAVTDVVGPNDSESTSTSLDTKGDADLNGLVAPGETLDAAVLTAQIVPTFSTITIRYAFGSEEYREWVGSTFNDVFGFFVNGQNCATVDNGPVSINSINDHTRSNLYRENPVGSSSIDIEPDGLTTVLTCHADVTPGQPNTLKLAIADTSDRNADSSVFLQANSVASTTGIRIVEDARPDAAQDFSFSGCAGASCASFALDDDNDPTLPNAVTGTGLAPGTYTLTQAAVPGWDLTDITCDTGEVIDLGQRRATITLTPGEQTTCTFTNPTTSITIVKDAQPDSPQDFNFSGCAGASCANFSLDDDEDPTLPNSLTGTGLAAGTYTLTEAATPGWDVSDITCDTGEVIDLGQRRATVTLTPGEQTTCIFTNAAPSITIVEDALPDSPQDFSFSGCAAASCASFALDDDDDPTLPNSVTGTALAPGTYTLTQAATPGDLADITCDTGEVIDLGQRRATVTLTPGEQTTCTFTNAVPSITIVEDAQPDSPQDFTFTGCAGATCGDFVLDDDENPAHANSLAIPVPSGTYAITQAAISGWALSDLVCDTGEVIDLNQRRATITVTPGEQPTCTFTNRATSITIVKDAQPDSPQDFNFSGCAGASCASFALDDDNDPTLANSVTGTALAPGTYTLTEAATAGWNVTDITCDTGEVIDLNQRRATVTLTPGEQTTCTFTNSTQATGSLTIVKDAEPDSPQDFSFTGCAGATCGNFVLDDDADPAHSNSLTIPTPTGTYTITEAAAAGWHLADIACDQDASVDLDQRELSIDIGPGENATCTFVNLAVPLNDDFDDAQVISGASGTTAGSNSGATHETGEPNHAGIAGGRSVWYRWTAPSSGTATIDLCGSDFDTLLAVYTGTAVDNLATVASNDDSCGSGSSVSFAATAGVTYRIAADGYHGDSGNITVNWHLV